MSDMKEASVPQGPTALARVSGLPLFRTWRIFFPYILSRKVCKNMCVCVPCVGLDRGVQRVTSVIESLVVGVCHVQVLSIICRLVPDSRADIHREGCACVWECECMQRKSLTPAHRGQTNALIRGWHAATIFSRFCPVGLSLPLRLPFSFFFTLSPCPLSVSFSLSLYSPHRLTQHICPVSFSCKARHQSGDSSARVPNEAVGLKPVVVISVFSSQGV